MDWADGYSVWGFHLRHSSAQADVGLQTEPRERHERNMQRIELERM